MYKIGYSYGSTIYVWNTGLVILERSCTSWMIWSTDSCFQEIDDSDRDEVELEIESNNGSGTVSYNSTITDSDCE